MTDDSASPRVTVGRLDCGVRLAKSYSLTGDALPAVLWRRADTGEPLGAGDEDEGAESGED